MNDLERPDSYEEVVERLAPCGLDCSRCYAREGGDIQSAALALREALAGFEHMAPRIEGRYPALAHYEHFREVLDLACAGGCPDCRSGGPEMPFCAARTCFREKGVDFCFQCDEYPCERNSYPENMAVRWHRYNDRMREVGVVQFYREQRRLPRYE